MTAGGACRLALLGVLAVLAAGCRDDGPPRPLHYEKGVYRGSPDTPPTAERREALRQRVANQRF